MEPLVFKFLFLPTSQHFCRNPWHFSPIGPFIRRSFDPWLCKAELRRHDGLRWLARWSSKGEHGRCFSRMPNRRSTVVQWLQHKHQRQMVMSHDSWFVVGIARKVKIHPSQHRNWSWNVTRVLWHCFLMLGYIVTLLDKISGYDFSMIYHQFMWRMCECASQDTIQRELQEWFMMIIAMECNGNRENEWELQKYHHSHSYGPWSYSHHGPTIAGWKANYQIGFGKLRSVLVGYHCHWLDSYRRVVHSLLVPPTFGGGSGNEGRIATYSLHFIMLVSQTFPNNLLNLSKQARIS